MLRQSTDIDVICIDSIIKLLTVALYGACSFRCILHLWVTLHSAYVGESLNHIYNITLPAQPSCSSVIAVHSSRATSASITFLTPVHALRTWHTPSDEQWSSAHDVGANAMWGSPLWRNRDSVMCVSSQLCAVTRDIRRPDEISSHTESRFIRDLLNCTHEHNCACMYV